MTDDRSFERAARTWLEIGPTRAPDHAVEAALLQVEQTPQERALRLPRRILDMNRLSLAVALAAVVVVGSAAVLLASRSPSTGTIGVPPSPTPPLTVPSVASLPPPTPVPSTTVDGSAFAVPFTMTWHAHLQTTVKSDVVELHASGTTGFNLFLIHQVGSNPCTSNDLSPTPLTTPQQFMDWLASIPKTTALPVTPVTIGGQAGLSRELDIGSLVGCIDTTSLHSGIRSVVDTVPGGFLMSAGERERWVAFTAGGKLIAFTVWPLSAQGYVTIADQAIATITFTSSPSPSP
jgi:hypothetical protein